MSRGVAIVGGVWPLITAENVGQSCSNELAKARILGGGPPRVTIMVVMGADPEGGLSLKCSQW